MVKVGPNVLVGCGEQGRTTELSIRRGIGMDQVNVNVNTTVAVTLTNHGYIEFLDGAGSNNYWVNGTGEWRNWPSSGRLFLPQNHSNPDLRIPLRVRTGQNIVRGSGIAVWANLSATAPNSNWEAWNPGIQLRLHGGKGCQTLEQNPTCTGHWEWGFDPITRQLIGPPKCGLE